MGEKTKKIRGNHGDNVQTGINSMMYIGNILGNNVFIGLGTVASGEVQPYTRIM